jgi:hypothetical protein
MQLPGIGPGTISAAGRCRTNMVTGASDCRSESRRDKPDQGNPTHSEFPHNIISFSIQSFHLLIESDIHNENHIRKLSSKDYCLIIALK